MERLDFKNFDNVPEKLQIAVFKGYIRVLETSLELTQALLEDSFKREENYREMIRDLEGD